MTGKEGGRAVPRLGSLSRPFTAQGCSLVPTEPVSSLVKWDDRAQLIWKNRKHESEGQRPGAWYRVGPEKHAYVWIRRPSECSRG